MKKLCIYHANCADGWTAAWAARNAFGDEVEFYPGVYQKDPPAVTGRDVLMVDFCYRLPAMQQIYAQAQMLTILDHHKTARETIGELQARDKLADVHKLAFVFDMERSGAGIAWDSLMGAVERPLLVDYVEDRDLWRFKLERSREVNACIFSYPYTFEAWDKLNAEINEDFWGVVQQGEAIERKHHKDIAELVEKCRYRMNIAGIDVPVASLPYTYSSDAGHLMAKGEKFAACYYDSADGREFSLRSADDGLDVSEIAKLYGGGGHARAAGFRLPHGQNP